MGKQPKIFKPFLLFFFAILSGASSFAQEEKNSEITSSGMASARVKPDQASFTLRVSKRNEVEKKALEELNKETEKLQQIFTTLGFTSEQIRISDYSISDYENDDKKTYTAANVLIVRFALDHKIIDAFYREIQRSGFSDLDVDFETSLSNELERSQRAVLVQQAIFDAKNRALNIASALNVKLGNVKNVLQYADRVYDEISHRKGNLKAYAPATSVPIRATAFDKYQVEEKQLEETITIIFEISKNK